MIRQPVRPCERDQGRLSRRVAYQVGSRQSGDEVLHAGEGPVAAMARGTPPAATGAGGGAPRNHNYYFLVPTALPRTVSPLL